MDDRKENRPISSNGPFTREWCPICGKNVEAYDAIHSYVLEKSESALASKLPLKDIVLFWHRANQEKCEGSRLKISLFDHLVNELQEAAYD